MIEVRAVEVNVMLIDALVEAPPIGTRVLALTVGGVLVPTVWCKHGLMFFEAWCAYPKIPSTVRERMSEAYREKF